MEPGDATLDALRTLLAESFSHWGCAGVTNERTAGEPGAGIAQVGFLRDGTPWLSLHRPAGDGPVRWVVESALPDVQTSRSRFPCTSVLDVLRTVRQLSDPDFEPGHRIRMGAPVSVA